MQKIRNQPFFSVIIPTYNRAHLLPKALDSLKKQTFKDFEVIVVDDGSIDNTLEILSKYPEFKYLQRRHLGQARAKNFGIKKAQGRYITFLDSDDWYLPRHLDIRKSVLVKNLKLELLHGGTKTLGNKYVPDYYKKGKTIHVDKILLGSTMVIKHKVFKIVGNFKNISYGEDTDFFARAKKFGIKMKKILNKTYIYNRGEDTITSSRNER